MSKAFNRAWELIFTGDKVIWDIIFRTLKMSLTSSLIAFVIGSLFGVLLAIFKFPGQRFIIRINKTLMGLPPVLAGLVVFILLSGTGLLGKYRLIFTMTAMVIAQVILITPIIVGMTESFAASVAPRMLAVTKGMNVGKLKTIALMFNESKYQLVSIYLMGFSRAIAEVGAVTLAGGSIANKTEVMTTAIMDYTNMGNFGYALGLGLMLLFLSLVVNGLVTFTQEVRRENSFLHKIRKQK